MDDCDLLQAPGPAFLQPITGPTIGHVLCILQAVSPHILLFLMPISPRKEGNPFPGIEEERIMLRCGSVCLALL